MYLVLKVPSTKPNLDVKIPQLLMFYEVQATTCYFVYFLENNLKAARDRKPKELRD
jgi:hypothetical protein